MKLMIFTLLFVENSLFFIEKTLFFSPFKFTNLKRNILNIKQLISQNTKKEWNFL
jgi:hypothetical protein